jgi:hypothetical protein
MAQPPRNIHTVVKQIRNVVPFDNAELDNALIRISEDAMYRAPELTYLAWEMLGEVLQYDMAAIPTEDWHFEAYSILSTLSVEEVRAQVASWTK